jgi:hypothetical protein
LIVFSSDNGPWISYGNHAGKTPYREAKGTGFDGGTRSACIMRYPGHIKAGTASSRAFCSVDLLPVMARLAGAALPKNPIDGLDVWDLITGKPGAKNPHQYYPFCTGGTFEGVISGDGRWKLHLPHEYGPWWKRAATAKPASTGKRASSFPCSTWRKTRSKPPTSSANSRTSPRGFKVMLRSTGRNSIRNQVE